MKQRLSLISEIHKKINEYESGLKNERRSLEEYLNKEDPMTDILLHGQRHPYLTEKDMEIINDFAKGLNSSSYREIITVVDKFLLTLEEIENKLQEDTASQGKAFPLLTGAIGFLIAVLLY